MFQEQEFIDGFEIERWPALTRDSRPRSTPPELSPGGRGHGRLNGCRDEVPGVRPGLSALTPKCGACRVRECCACWHGTTVTRFQSGIPSRDWGEVFAPLPDLSSGIESPRSDAAAAFGPSAWWGRFWPILIPLCRVSCGVRIRSSPSRDVGWGAGKYCFEPQSVLLF